MNTYRYDDICLVPKFSELKSRSYADTSFTLGEHTFKVPVIPSNMKAVINNRLSNVLSGCNYMYSMHRFGVDNTKFIDTANRYNWPVISISIGVKKHDWDLIQNIATNGSRVDYITVDIAHGHCQAMRDTLQYIRSKLPNVFVIAGNVAISGAVKELASWGASAVKIGIGQGSPCTTKDKTGFTMPMFTCVQNCSGVVHDGKKVPIIADGGIRCNGDIAKALVAGADAVKDHIEGVLKKIPASDMTYTQKLVEIAQDLQSSISYAGGSDLSAFDSVEYYINKI